MEPDQPPEVTEDEAKAARSVVAEYDRQQQEAADAARAAYAVPVTAMIESDAFKAVYAALLDMLANQSDDSFFGMPVEALRTISRNLAFQVGLTLDEAVPEPEPAAGPEPTPA